MNTGQVTAIIQAGFLLLAEATKDVTGSPEQLRAKADDCARCATESTNTAETVQKIITALGQQWHGYAYQRANQSSTSLRDELVTVLRAELQRESQRLGQAATALTQAKSAVEQQKQNFAQQANTIIQTMMQDIARARAMPSPMDRVMVVLAILKAVQAAMSAKQSAQSASDATRNQLSGVLSSLFSTAGSGSQLTGAVA